MCVDQEVQLTYQEQQLQLVRHGLQVQQTGGSLLIWFHCMCFAAQVELACPEYDPAAAHKLLALAAVDAAVQVLSVVERDRFQLNVQWRTAEAATVAAAAAASGDIVETAAAAAACDARAQQAAATKAELQGQFCWHWSLCHMDFAVLLGFPTHSAIVKADVHGAVIELVGLTDLLLGLVILH